jgi:hypothetical protein
MANSFEDQVLAKLDYLLRVHTISLTRGMKQNEQIALLNRAGLPPTEIAGHYRKHGECQVDRNA